MGFFPFYREDPGGDIRIHKPDWPPAWDRTGWDRWDECDEQDAMDRTRQGEMDKTDGADQIDGMGWTGWDGMGRGGVLL